MSYYGKIAEYYDASRWMTHQAAEISSSKICDLVDAKFSTRFLELGAGTGINILPIIEKGFNVTAVDVSNEMLDQLRRKVSSDHNNLVIIKDDATKVDFPPDSFDVVLTVHLLHLISDRPTFFQKISETIASNGWFLDCKWLTPPARRVLEIDFINILEGSNSTSDILSFPNTSKEQALCSLGFEYRHEKIHSWLVSETISDILGYFKQRAFGFCWRYPENEYFQSLDQFTDLCKSKYGSLDFRLESTATFDIDAYHKQY